LGTLYYTLVVCLTVRLRSEAGVALAGLLAIPLLLAHIAITGPLATRAHCLPVWLLVNPFFWLVRVDGLAWPAHTQPAFLTCQALLFAGLLAFGVYHWRRSL
jgi:hypothetical protein